MDTIFLRQLQFYGYHGVLPEERVTGQNFLVDLDLYCTLVAAGSTDLLDQTIDYAAVYHRVQVIVETRSYQLLEALAQAIASDLLEVYLQLQAIKIRITKPVAPIKGLNGQVGIEILRERNQ